MWLCGLGLEFPVGPPALLRAALLLLRGWGMVAPGSALAHGGLLAAYREVLLWPERPTSLSLLASPDPADLHFGYM